MRNQSTILRHVRELIAALDARLPQPQRADEAGIALAAAALRLRALDRIAELEAAPAAIPGAGAP
jgi:hypothetical protein